MQRSSSNVMPMLIPVLAGFFVSIVVSILGSPVLANIWGPINQASTVFIVMAIVVKIAKKRGEAFTTLIVILAGIFFLDFLIGKYYENTSSGGNSGLVLLLGSVVILALTVLFVPIMSLLEKKDSKSIFFYCSILAFVIYLYGIIYGGITPGVSDGPKLAAIISIILFKLKREQEFDDLWNALFIMGVLGNFIIPAITILGGLLAETL